jgi:[NiFe] hydrogenase assembly HybE family chaperone
VNTGIVRHLDDPSARLEAAFRRIEAERMADVPMLNHALDVEAVGFARRDGRWLGVLVTPWFMNLVLLPAEGEWESVTEGERIFRRFAGRDYAFLGGREPEVGEFQCCSLFSPMGEMPNQDSVRAIARAVLLALDGEPDPSVAIDAARSPSVEKRRFLRRFLPLR